MLIRDIAVVKNKKIQKELYELIFYAPSLASQAQPGQFVHIKIPHSPCILRRPFSIYDTDKQKVMIVYRVVGKVTESMTALKKNDVINVIGPLGNGFKCLTKKYPILVAGGTGFATLHFLRKALPPGILFFGACSKNHVWGLSDFKKIGWKIIVAAEDGTQGTKGLITDVFVRYIKQIQARKNIYAYICGPMGMMQEMAKICRTYSIAGEASLESIMACGVGACQGCAVELKKNDTSYQRVCVDGPVFDIRQL